jgi:hypothetical protein
MIRLSDSISLPAFLLVGQVLFFRNAGLPTEPFAARVTVGWMVFLLVCLIHAIWQRRREKAV